MPAPKRLYNSENGSAHVVAATGYDCLKNQHGKDGTDWVVDYPLPLGGGANPSRWPNVPAAGE